MPTARLRAARSGDLAANFSYFDLHPTADDFFAEVMAGLARRPKSLPCKFFYDAAGSRLFERICEIEEYYPTRIEMGLLRRHRREIAALFGPDANVIEFGCGATTKIRVLLDAIGGSVAYTGVDISKEQLVASGHSLAVDFPNVRVAAVCADYTRPFTLPGGTVRSDEKKVGFFPGSTVGNFTRGEARSFLAGAAKLLGPGGEFLVGVDLRKDVAILRSAYNDRGGVTAAFNLNLLARINRELGADFDLSAFSHDAPYNEAEGRIEMYLVSKAEQTVRIAGNAIPFRRGEAIHTENSHKYGIDEFRNLADLAGFEHVRAWTDEGRLFSLHYLRAR
jgi:dimethylhistidine N-methyltransferase